MGNSKPLFLNFRLFKTVDSKQMFNINFADDWIRSADLWYRKRPLYQLSQNHMLLGGGTSFCTFRGRTQPASGFQPLSSVMMREEDYSEGEYVNDYAKNSPCLNL